MNACRVIERVRETFAPRAATCIVPGAFSRSMS